ncbi:MAG TPA: recombinase A [candidate division Zixibacteria bacterium]|nr:recombinase A [candidate division Zixibacteria bacterium]
MLLAPARKFDSQAVEISPWSHSALSGRFVEISGAGASAALTAAFGLVLQAQQRGEAVGWVTLEESSFYPPDAAERGVDLGALAVVRVGRPEQIARAGEKLLRSGGFGLVVLDLGEADVPMPLQSRLCGLAHHHHTALVCLTAKERRRFSLSSLVSLRVQAERNRAEARRFTCALRVLKDKRRGPTWSHTEVCHGPAGLR